ncbi:amidase signature domain-containing protein [Stachybotrys elegans]|uniref:Amidase signature domain-containing protein n=1 Tax=Stachybotrys elegans TaxID=80388 RepID=A0A8K0SLH7_9HYPO|nr:amidase signature domain-containing protein [Stachybotrys elegans]
MKSLITCVVAGVQYLVHPQKLGSIQETINPDALIPVTLLSTSEIFGDVDGLLRLYDIYDDVFMPEFGSILVEKPGDESSDAAFDLRGDYPQSQQLYHLEQLLAVSDVGGLPSGPYFLHGPNLHQTWRLYEDTNDAFTFGVIPEAVGNPEKFRAVSSLAPSGSSKAIPVPSRLYQPPPNRQRPLSGIRFSVTDTLSLSGVSTTLSSRSWTLLHNSSAESTSRFIQNLLNMGAVVVGKTKTSQFDTGHEWVDAAAPWNPRADGYQSPSWGSAGAAAALAAYDWLEYSIGQDAIEGIRHAAALNGLFSIRLSGDSVSLDGLQRSSETFDTLGVSSRNLQSLINSIAAISNSSKTGGVLPTRIILPIDMVPPMSEEEKGLFTEFVTCLEKFLGTKTQPVVVGDAWAENPPTEANGLGMQEYMKEVPFRLFCHNFYRTYEGFGTEYREAFESEPFQEATVKFRWEFGKNISEAESIKQKERLTVFRRWFSEAIMPLDLKDGSTIMVLPWPIGEPSYRDKSPLPPKAVDFSAELLAPVLQTPQLLVPFAQLPYQSRISAETEYRAVFGSVIGPRGSDLMVAQIVERAFELANWRNRVDTGRFSFPIGKNSRNVDDKHVPATRCGGSATGLLYQGQIPMLKDARCEE